MSYEDILYEVRDGAAHITINRPDKYNAFRGKTCEELIDAFNRAGWDKSIGVIVLAGAGDKAFCTGGDQSAHEGQYDGRGTIGLPMEDLHTIMRDVPKPVIAKVQGFAIGGGNVLATICDMTIAGEKAQFGQVGPKVGSVDPGYGTAYLARAVGDPILMGAPNVVRGGSQSGNIAAQDLVRERLCDALVSDYYYPALVQAAFLLVDEEMLDLPQAWAMISSRPAEILRLPDRGVIDYGRRADLAVVNAVTRVVEATFCESRITHLAGEAAQRFLSAGNTEARLAAE